MNLFHVSENPSITQFDPRPSQYTEKPAVWAVDEAHLHNYLLPRDCPRVTYYALPNSKPEDITHYLDSSRAVVAVEGKWLPAIQAATLTIYQIPSSGFYAQDEGAGYWICENKIIPQARYAINNCLAELSARQVEIRFLPELWTLHDAILASSLQFSFIRMRNAEPRKLAKKTTTRSSLV